MTGIKKRLGSLLGPQGPAGTEAANARFDEIERKSDNAVTRVEHIETMAGLAPGEVTDAQTANLLQQPDSSTRAAFGQAMVTEIVTQNSAGRAALNNAIDDKIDTLPPSDGGAVLGALGVLRARMSAGGPILIVGVGDSYVDSTNVPADYRWINLLAAEHSNEPVIFSWEALEPQTSFPDGIQFANAGRSGHNSITYLTVPEAAILGEKNPALVIHMVGANDWSRDMDKEWASPSSMARAIGERVDAIDAAATLPVGHLVVHGHARNDANVQNPKHTWEEYLQGRRTVAIGRPNVTVLDMSALFRAFGIPGPDPLAMLEVDKVHLNEEGMTVYAREFGNLLNLPEAIPPIPPEIVLTDTFTRSDGPLVGTTADTGQVWEAGSGTFTITDGKVAASGTGATALIDTGHAEVDYSVDMIRKNDSLGGVAVASTDHLQGYLVVYSGVNSRLTIFKNTNGSPSSVANTTVPEIPIGDEFVLRVTTFEGSLVCYTDGIERLTHQMDALTSDATKIGFYASGGAVTWDNVSVLAIPTQDD